VCHFKKGKTSIQTEAKEILKRGSDNVVPTDNIQDHIEFYYSSESLFVFHNTLYGLSSLKFVVFI
jgi:hypothetical protein